MNNALGVHHHRQCDLMKKICQFARHVLLSRTVGGFPSLQASTYSAKLYDVICLSEWNPPESGLPLHGRLLKLLNRLATVASSEQHKTKQIKKTEKLKQTLILENNLLNLNSFSTECIRFADLDNLNLTWCFGLGSSQYLEMTRLPPKH